MNNIFFKRNYSLLTGQLKSLVQIKNCTDTGKRILITGGLGQLGKNLATILRDIFGHNNIILSDINKLGYENRHLAPFQYLNIIDKNSIEEAVVNNEIDTIIHFSALLSAIGEQNVPLALQVNGTGVQNVLEVARTHKLQVFIPSTIGAFGPTSQLDDTPDLTIQRPRTIYGVTKVYAELLGEYYYEKYGVDFRSLRFPGIISAAKPGGGTTDYAIKIFFDAIKYGKHTCYLKPDTKLPMMYDSDCMASVVMFLAAPKEKLSLRTYNVTGFSFTPEEISAEIRKIMPNFEIDYKICPIRQGIAETWPRSLNDSLARNDWQWKAQYNLKDTVKIMFDLVGKQINGDSNISTQTKLSK
ncbi:NAD-dependent epimerase/dehydratase domain and NAD(P)-binding domain-containing protein [Strongyloides ratti]|uniref:L-threonine 3-dehydrogenase, mitochondrial n=1 Tax=Strongyloides ratti TaxID=34506 RepID=A0A090L4M0_STRRB|nr:NAD-dependent epimerase/dehydratase domain and NAD(P)-binding domain-containing protein [Strongyloides ratti]CEF62449.1 NAD-dependent epimerase/dehydratase domain and NAD(P)-binding domain-containing protein [Strongyloides ratti]